MADSTGTLSTTPFGDPFWTGVNEGDLRVPFCRRCDRYFFSPRPFCPGCWSEEVTWRSVSGRGTVWSFSVVHFPFFLGEWEQRIPYTVALIELEEGARLMSNVVGCAPSDVRIGLLVEVVYETVDGRRLPMFRPASAR